VICLIKTYKKNKILSKSLQVNGNKPDIFTSKELHNHPKRDEMLTDEALKHLLLSLDYPEDKVSSCLAEMTHEDKTHIFDSFAKSTKENSLSNHRGNITRKFKCIAIQNLNDKVKDDTHINKISVAFKRFSKKFRL